MDNNTDYIEQLFALPPYCDDETRRDIFARALRDELIFHYENNDSYRRFCDGKGFDPHKPDYAIADIPEVSVSVFKALGADLVSVPKEQITLSLQSSATSGIPSTIAVDKVTSRRQSKAMVRVMGEFIGKSRLPFLVMDINPSGADRRLLGARFAAVTGYLKFANRMGFFLKARDNGTFYFDIDAIEDFLAKEDSDKPVVVFGFSYIMYQHVLSAIEESGRRLQLPKGSKIIHIGGWKKLESEKVSKPVFNRRMADAFGIDPEDVIDIYGFTEQMGLNYPDCACGCKHTSAYVDIIVRDPRTREIVADGTEGMLEFISPIPHSYPGNAVITDDLGLIVPGECPLGRPGKRFRVTGRMKKAEVRGCGDILSEKLTFSARTTENTGSQQLAVEYCAHQIPDGTPEQKLDFIINALRAEQAWLAAQPVEAIIGLVDMAAKKWISAPELAFLKDKGLMFLSQWCSAEHLTRVATMGLHGNIHYADDFLPFPDSDRHLLKSTPKGLVCHWLAGNVQILGMFALVQCIVAKNVNLLKVSKTDDGVFASLVKSFEGLEYTTAQGHTISGDRLARTIAVVYFSRHDAEIGRKMSAQADVRIAWGGREAVETVASYPAKFNASTVIFGPKLSFAVVAAEALSDENSAKKLARRLSVDVSVFDQTGCASPHHVYVERGGSVTPERFCEVLAAAFPKTELQIPKPPISVAQAAEIHSARGIYDFKGKVWGSESMSWTILFSPDYDGPEWSKPVYSRVIVVHPVDNIDDALAVVTPGIQSIGIDAPDAKAVRFATKAASMGVARFPKIGRMLNFEMPWDGMFLFERVVDWHTLFGPLC